MNVEPQYHELKGTLLSMTITDWAKAMLLRDLDQIYEELLRLAEIADAKTTFPRSQDSASTATSSSAFGSSAGKDSSENSW